jgi:hypothetical protein
VTLTGGSASEGGGAIRVQNDSTRNGELNLVESAIVGNQAGSGSVGGGIFFMPKAFGTITGSVIASNSAGWGGGLFLGNVPVAQSAGDRQDEKHNRGQQHCRGDAE